MQLGAGHGEGGWLGLIADSNQDGNDLAHESCQLVQSPLEILLMFQQIASNKEIFRPGSLASTPPRTPDDGKVDKFLFGERFGEPPILPSAGSATVCHVSVYLPDYRIDPWGPP